MMLYRQQREQMDSRSWLARVSRQVADLDRQPTVTYDRVVHALIDAGELAAALADAIDADTSPAVAHSLEATVALARAADTTWSGRPIGDSLRCAAVAFARVATLDMPPVIARGVSEGFAYYAVGPELYGEAVSRWAARCRPRTVCCIGLRTIGLTLAAAAAARLSAEGMEATAMSVRPTGHPFDRRVVIPSSVVGALTDRARAWWLVIDEGPGLSGSSIASAARVLVELGVPADRIVLMPSYVPDVSKLTPSAAAIWARHAVVAADFDRTWIASGRLARGFGAAGLCDIAGGNWRALARLNERPAVQPQHERRKYLLRVASSPTRTALLKFAGYGRYGAATIERARAAADAGWAPPVVAAVDGWLAHPWLDTAESVGQAGDGDVAQLADYVAFIARTRRCSDGTTPADLREMAAANLRACSGDATARALEVLPLPEMVEPVHTDNRLQRHEWVRVGGRLLKTDGVDHGDDHFFPGPTDIAWDLAGAIEEWRLDDAASDRLLTRYVSTSRDRTIRRRLRFYRVAYLAFRAGYSRFAAEQLGAGDDGNRFRRAHVHYRARVKEVLACACS